MIQAIAGVPENRITIRSGGEPAENVMEMAFILWGVRSEIEMSDPRWAVYLRHYLIRLLLDDDFWCSDKTKVLQAMERAAGASRKQQ